MHLVRSLEQFFETAEAEDANSSGGEAWLADPNVMLTVDVSVLRVTLLQQLVHLVSLVHDVEVGDLPPSEGQHV